MIKVGFAEARDVGGWMALVDGMRDAFPGLESDGAMIDHRRSVLEFMARQEAICAREDENIVGCMLFSRKENMLCFLAVDSKHRRRGIARKMVERMLEELSGGSVRVTTYREDAATGVAARAFYRRLGFVPGRLGEEFGSPVQEFVLVR